MSVEAEAIPFEPAPLLGERLLVVAPHPDDEVIACGGVVAQHLSASRAVWVLVATDGAAAQEGGGDSDYRSRREDESRRGLEILGGNASITFLRLPDRELASRAGEFQQALKDALLELKPTLILVPSPIEIHPDHAAAAVAFCELIQRDERLFAELATARVAFYELTQPIRPNTIVDISDVAETKYEAIAVHETQASNRDYAFFARGLGAYRAMTMPAGTKYAEAYYVVPLPDLRTIAVGTLQRALGDARIVTSNASDGVPVSVIVRTKDRPALLRQALQSIRATGYPAEVIIVNDGGEAPDWLRETAEGNQRTRVVTHERSRGRAEAANAGVRAATAELICFLDDDDLFYPEHLLTLTRGFCTSDHPAVYTDAVSAFVAAGASGGYETRSRLRLFANDFDPDLLLVDNYIPLPTLMLRRRDFLDLGGFDPEFDLFEDWDFLIRLASRGEFVRVPRVTCEIRHIEGAGSITMSTPEGSAGFREAKLKVWRKHAGRIDNATFARAFEKQKRLIVRSENEAVEQLGRVHHLGADVTRLEREKSELIGRLQTAHELAVRADETAVMLSRSQSANEEKAVRIARLEEENAGLRNAVDETGTTVQALFSEVRRLQSLLDMIYSSRTWKLHTMVEKVRGRD